MSNSSFMVIIGDSVHNFADGIAIGAAFAIGQAAGFSTSIAVLCHELPHEIGDFALLLQNGMSTKHALFFNLVSSIFGFIGTVIGLFAGSNEGFSSWMLAAIVGVFIYVSLVSMLPELSAPDLSTVFINAGSMVLGLVILLVIGLYEHDLIQLLS